MKHIHAAELMAETQVASAEAALADVGDDFVTTYIAGVMFGIAMMVAHSKAGIYLFNEFHNDAGASSMESGQMVDLAVHEMFCKDESCPIQAKQ